MIFIETNSESAYHNFAVEYYFMTEKQLDDTAFMFWRTQPTLMIGHFQNTYREVNLDYANSHDIQIVRRMSGGGTIYTDMGGWQFTFISKGSDGQISFMRFIEPVVRALRGLGADAGFNGRNDLVVDGKKFSGNAQYIKGGNTLHHGSILFNTDIDEMVRSTTVDKSKIISKGIKSVRDRVANISDYLTLPITMEEFKTAMVESIMSGERNTYTLTNTDLARIREIETAQFNNWQKIFGDSPRCSIQKSKRFSGGTVQSYLDVEKGCIRNIKIYGDFFGDIDIGAVCELLKGCEYRKESVLCTVANSVGGLYGISAEEFAEALF